MTSSKRGWLIAVATLWVGYEALYCHNKIQNCSGWGRLYHDRAAQLRREADAPDRTPYDQTEYRLAAEWQDIVGDKYLHVASRPWLPYPRAPLITEVDKAVAIERAQRRYPGLDPYIERE
jgi:hypothetical protein